MAVDPASMAAPSAQSMAPDERPATNTSNTNPTAAPAPTAHEPNPRPSSSVDVALLRGLALFSTDIGRRKKRDQLEPPYNPVIVVSDKIQAVVDFARRMETKYPQYYLCYFPGCGHAIEDLWDNEDIHLHSPGFLQEVLTYITQHNVHRAQDYAQEWSLANRDRLHVVVEVEYNPEDPLAIVDEVFINGEENNFPRPFLWHVANIMRYGMCEVAKNVPVSCETVAGAVAKAPDSNASKPPPVTAPAAEHTSTADSGDKPLPECPSLSNGLQFDPKTEMMGQVPLPAGAQDTFYPQPPMHPPRPLLQFQPPMHPMADPATAPPMDLPLHGTIKTRKYRSGSYGQASQSVGRTENVPLANAGPLQRRASFTMSNMASPHLNPPMPVASPMFNNGYPMGNMMSPSQLAAPMHPHRATVPPQMQTGYRTGPYMEFQQPYHINNGGQRAVSIGDMTNGSHPFNGNMNVNDPNGPRYRQDSRADRQHPHLYNPYKERPEFANIPLPLLQSGHRRGSRSSLSNSLPRGRRQSSGSGGPTQLGPGSFEPTNQNGGALPYPRPSRVGDLLQQRPEFHPTPDPSDPQRGCGENWIGPWNTAVNELIIFDTPPTANENDIIAFFRQHAGVDVTSVRLRKDVHGKFVSNVRFMNVADAQRGLLLDRRVRLHQRPVSIKVPERYYNNRMGPGHRSVAGLPPRIPEFAQALNNAPATLSDAPRPTYSPQDARSDFAQGQTLDQGKTVGSPEVRKGKKQSPPLFKKGSASPNKKNGADLNRKRVPSPPKKGSASSMTITASEQKKDAMFVEKPSLAVQGTSAAGEIQRTESSAGHGKAEQPPNVTEQQTKAQSGDVGRGADAATKNQTQPKTIQAGEVKKETDAVAKNQNPAREPRHGQPGKSKEARPEFSKQHKDAVTEPPKQRNNTKAPVLKAKDDTKLQAAEQKGSPKPAQQQLKTGIDPTGAKPMRDAFLQTHRHRDSPHTETRAKGDKSKTKPPRATLDATKQKGSPQKADPNKGATKPRAPDSVEKKDLAVTESKADAIPKVVSTDEAKKEARRLGSDMKLGVVRQGDRNEVLPKPQEQNKAESGPPTSGMKRVVEGSVTVAVKNQTALTYERVDTGRPTAGGAETGSKETNSGGPALAEPNITAPRTVLHEDAGSDEEQKNDSSFHSAKEAQSDSGNDEAAEVKSEAPTQDRQPSEIPSGGGNQLLASVSAEPNNKPLKETPSPNAPMKKPGANQTEAIFPFAKSKRQRELEKQQKKKEKKKAKSEKLAPGPKSTAPGTEKGTATSPHQRQKRIETGSGAVAGTEVEESVDIKDEEPGKEGGKEITPLKAPVGDFDHRSIGTPVEKTKQEVPNGRPREGGVPLAEKETEAARVEKTSPVKAGELKDTSLDTSATDTSPANEHPSAEDQSSEKNAVNRPDGSQLKIVVTDSLGVFQKNDSPATSQGHQTHDAKPDVDVVPVIAKASSLQVANPPPFSPSPTAAEFHTPLQTPLEVPAELTVPNSEQPKAKKRKPKKKNKKGIAVQSITSEPEPSSDEPFLDQLREISSAKKNLEEHSTRNLSASSPTQSTHEQTDTRKPRNILGDVLGFMRERPLPRVNSPPRPGNSLIVLGDREIDVVMGRPVDREMDIDSLQGARDSESTLTLSDAHTSE